MELQGALETMSNEIAAKLGVADEKEVDLKPMMGEYQDHYRQFLGPVVQALRASHGGRIIKVNLAVPQNFDLQLLFDKWFTVKSSDGAFLFQDHDYTQKLMGHWEVQYEGKLDSGFANACHPVPPVLKSDTLGWFCF